MADVSNSVVAVDPKSAVPYRPHGVHSQRSSGFPKDRRD